MQFPIETLDQARKSREQAKADLEQLNQKVRYTAQFVKFWEDFCDFLQKGWVFHLLCLIEKNESLLQKMKSELQPWVPFVEEARQKAKEETNRILCNFPKLIEDAFEDAFSRSELSLDGSSRHPKYTMKNGFFLLEIDEKKRTARLSDYERRLAEIPADIESIIEVVKKEKQRLFEREYDGFKFLQELRAQYKAILKKKNQPDGASIPVREIARRLGKNRKKLRTDEFLVELSRLALHGPFEIDGRRLELQQTRDTNQGMLLIDAAGRGYIGFIVFKEL